MRSVPFTRFEIAVSIAMFSIKRGTLRWKVWRSVTHVWRIGYF